jgi:hypothetical protein
MECYWLGNGTFVKHLTCRKPAFGTLFNDVTKPNPFEIIPLQTTRKESIWKTEEALAGAVVGDGTDQRVQSLMFMMMMMMMNLMMIEIYFYFE